MKKVLFNKSLTLVKVTQNYGHSGGTSETSLAVKGDVSMPSLTLKTSVEGVGRKIDLTAQVWKRDFDRDTFTHVDYSGTRYRIENIGSSINDLFVKLSLARGV